MDGHIPLDLGLPAGEPELEAGNDSNSTERGLDLTSWKKVYRHAYSLVGNEAEAEDLTQETFVELFRAQSAGKPVQWISSWMRTVTKRLAYRNYRKQRPDLHTSLGIVTQDGKHVVLDIRDTQPSPEQRVINDTMVRLSAKVLSEFSDRERECVLMYFRGYDFAQIASAVGVSRWTARRLTLDVVKRVRARLQPV